ncbi:MAG: hypothetical protein GWN12_06365, partial [Thermoplasmata archaeon]|nr:hypothetical protein [Thermoplasmata archaeon]NIW88404.1 hypothetical protein [Thermoplasmata archaeon]
MESGPVAHDDQERLLGPYDGLLQDQAAAVLDEEGELVLVVLQELEVGPGDGQGGTLADGHEAVLGVLLFDDLVPGLGIQH